MRNELKERFSKYCKAVKECEKEKVVGYYVKMAELLRSEEGSTEYIFALLGETATVVNRKRIDIKTPETEWDGNAADDFKKALAALQKSWDMAGDKERLVLLGRVTKELAHAFFDGLYEQTLYYATKIIRTEPLRNYFKANSPKAAPSQAPLESNIISNN
jgi:hypothetical protein